jgi:hypothetical protein
MHDHKYLHLPVRDEESGKVIGIVDVMDLITHSAGGESGGKGWRDFFKGAMAAHGDRDVSDTGCDLSNSNSKRSKKGAGKSKEYHTEVFANAPATEGDGYSEELLLGLAETVGITGADLETFTSCVTDGTYEPWALNSTQVFYDSNIPGTPLIKINGQEINASIAVEQETLEQAIAEASK